MTGGGRSYGFAYDPAGRLHEVTASGLASRAYAWDGNDAIVTYANGQFLARTVYGPGENEPLYQVDNQGRRIWFAHDERGSTVGSSDTAGAATGRIAYDEYGNSTSGAYQHGYTGALHLRTTGLYYMRARIYDPKLGRFLQPDPIGYGDGMNMYAYVGGDPVNGTDPSGTMQCYASRITTCSEDAYKADAFGQLGPIDLSTGRSAGWNDPAVTGHFVRVGRNVKHSGDNMTVTATFRWVPPQRHGPQLQLASADGPSLRNFLDRVLGPANTITEASRTITTLDLGSTRFGHVIVHGTIRRTNTTMKIFLNALYARPTRGGSVVLQGLNVALARAREMGLATVEIGGVVNNPRVRRYIESIVMTWPGAESVLLRNYDDGPATLWVRIPVERN